MGMGAIPTAGEEKKVTVKRFRYRVQFVWQPMPGAAQPKSATAEAPPAGAAGRNPPATAASRLPGGRPPNN